MRERQPPDPFPVVRPVPEYLASGELAHRYEDVKAVLQVPWMGVVTMAFAHYPTFFAELWGGLRELCASAPFVGAMGQLRAFAEAETERLGPPPITGRLEGLGYAERELDRIRDVVEIFSHGNQPYVTIATIARLLLEGGSFGRPGAVTPFLGTHAPKVAVPLVLMEAHHADEPTRTLYEDLKATLGLPIVNTDYRALARWPSYFALAWCDLRPHVGRPDYEVICKAVHDMVTEIVRALPNPTGLDGARLRAAAAADADPEEVASVVRLFQWLLPGLIVNVAFFRAQLR